MESANYQASCPAVNDLAPVMVVGQCLIAGVFFVFRYLFDQYSELDTPEAYRVWHDVRLENLAVTILTYYPYVPRLSTNSIAFSYTS